MKRKICQPGTVLNHKTRRCVQINGKIGRSIGAKSTPDNKYTLQKVTTLNGDAIYQVYETDSDCVFHFYKRQFTNVYINICCK